MHPCAPTSLGCSIRTSERSMQRAEPCPGHLRSAATAHSVRCGTPTAAASATAHRGRAAAALRGLSAVCAVSAATRRFSSLRRPSGGLVSPLQAAADRRHSILGTHAEHRRTKLTSGTQTTLHSGHEVELAGGSHRSRPSWHAVFSFRTSDRAPLRTNSENCLLVYLAAPGRTNVGSAASVTHPAGATHAALRCST